ncbi:hypothetical protein O3P69_006176 [Scylla paramamosain]|uniref:Uncharacterized protein n=1 Tax=Scylla paramamosain TaxID=85552 RepID=A0AAW0U6C5_SCYPA
MEDCIPATYEAALAELSGASHWSLGASESDLVAASLSGENSGVSDTIRCVAECCVRRPEDDVCSAEGAAVGGLSCAGGGGDLWRVSPDCPPHPDGRA